MIDLTAIDDSIGYMTEMRSLCSVPDGNVAKAYDTALACLRECAERRSFKQKTESTMTREGFNDLETMIAKYKTVMLAANETSIEQDEEIDVLKTALAESQRRERAAVKDLSIDSHCTLCKHHRSEGGDCYGVSKCAIKGIKTQWQWRGPEAGKGEAE